ncbi:DUF7507 domain-containing protein [Nostocoides japonicum]|uniref:DUF7507 domain-containing protein n=1 Tax=Nostocoides japonicum TaxID=99481 RepID=UPI001F1BA94D|nr:hypothetical protein [Tetrasphaera japonica]
MALSARVAKPDAKIGLSQWLSEAHDIDHNGFFDPHDYAVFSFRVTNLGSLTLSDVSVIDKRLAKAKVSISCPYSILAPGASMTCKSGKLVVTPYLAKNGLGINYATAQGRVPAGWTASSSTVKRTYGTAAVADPVPGILAFTGVDSRALLLSGLVLIILGGVACGASSFGRGPAAR